MNKDIIKEKLVSEWLENTHHRTQCLKKYIGREFTDPIKKELQKHCHPYIGVQKYDNEVEFLNERKISATHTAENTYTWVICLVSNNVILDIDFARG